MSKERHRQKQECPQFDLRIDGILLCVTKTHLHKPQCQYISELSILQKHSLTLIQFCLL